MLIQEAKEISQEQTHTFQDTYFESSQIYLLRTMYCFEHTTHDIILNFLVQNIITLLVCA